MEYGVHLWYIFTTCVYCHREDVRCTLLSPGTLLWSPHKPDDEGACVGFAASEATLLRTLQKGHTKASLPHTAEGRRQMPGVAVWDGWSYTVLLSTSPSFEFWPKTWRAWKFFI